MNKLLGFVLLFAVLVLVSVSYLTYAKNASAITFTTGPCPNGEAKDYMGICFPLNECKSGPFAAAGTCKVSNAQCTNGKCTVSSNTHGQIRSPILGGENKHSLKHLVKAAINATISAINKQRECSLRNNCPTIPP